MTYVADVNEKSTPVDCICHTSFKKSPRKPRSHTVQSEYMFASQNLCETASRIPAIAHTYLYTVIFKMKEGAVKLRANDPMEKQISRLSSRSPKLNLDSSSGGDPKSQI